MPRSLGRFPSAEGSHHGARDGWNESALLLASEVTERVVRPEASHHWTVLEEFDLEVVYVVLVQFRATVRGGVKNWVGPDPRSKLWRTI